MAITLTVLPVESLVSLGAVGGKITFSARVLKLKKEVGSGRVVVEFSYCCWACLFQ